MCPDSAHRLQWLIEHRHSSRAPYDPAWRVTEAELDHIVDAARWAPTAHNMQNYRLVVIDDRGLLEAIGKVRSTVSPEFIAENFRQLSWSDDELAQRRVGILGTTFPPAWRTDDPARVPTHESRLLSETIAGAPMVIIALVDSSKRAPASKNDELGMISLGCVLENMWLAAEASHLDTQVVSAFANDAAEPQIRKLLGAPEPWRVAFALRLGHALGSPRGVRVRRFPEELVGRNRFA